MKKILLFYTLLCCVTFNAVAQEKEFWFVAPDVSEAHGNCDAPTFLVISNPTDNQVIVSVTIDGGTPAVGSPYTIPVGGSKQINWNQTDTRALIENPRSTAGTITNKSIHIEVISGDGVLAYYQVDGSCSKDLFSLKGPYALGDEFYIPMMQDNKYPSSYADGYDQIDIVAAKATRVYFTITKACVNYSVGTHHVDLAAGQTFKLMEAITPGTASSTLAGTKITADVPNSIAITVTEDCAQSGGSTDVMGDQIVPVSCTGTRYVVVKGQTSGGATDRLYFTASTGASNVTVTGDGGFSSSVSLSAAGETDVIDLGNSGTTPNVVYVEATSPVYCYHVSAAGTELGSALIPSMFSITQQQLAFFAANTAISDILLVFRDTCENYFEISNDGVTYVPLTVTANPIPGLTGSVTWRWDKLTLPAGYRNNNLVTIRNTESPFSLGYFNGNTTGTSGYGYISGFGDWSLPYDTLWRCQGSNAKFTLMGGYALGYDWELPDGSHINDIAITLRDTGRYTIDMDVDYKHILDTVYMYELTLDPQIERYPNKPAKVGVPQKFTAVSNSNIPNAKYKWTFEGGNPATSTLASPIVYWNSTGPKKVTLTIEIEAGSGVTKTVCDKTVVLDLDVRPKNNGYFVDQNVSGGLRDGSNWQNAFTTVQEALNLASQGDYIWVAEGEYSPYGDQTYVVDYDSVQIYGGFGGWEANLAERSIGSHPTVLKGSNNSVVTFKGGTNYANYPIAPPCGLSTETVLDGFIIQDGKAQHGAGILFTNGGTATIANCVIRQNTATVSGGGIYLEAPTCGQASPILTTVEISGNTAPQGAGMYNAGSDFRATHITVGGNKATTGGGLYNAGGDPIILNSIIWGNRDASVGEIAMDITVSAGTPAYAYSDIGGSNGSGSSWNTALGTDDKKNIDVKPLYRNKGFDEDGTTMVEGNYRLTTSSKPVNEGNNVYVHGGHRLLRDITLLTPTDGDISTQIRADLDGMSRISYDIVDMGAYEFYNEELPPNIKREVLVPEHPYLTTDPEAGAYFITGHKDFKLTLFPKEGYSLDNLDIKTGSIYQDELGNMEIIRNQDGSVTIIFHEITEPLNIVINGVSPVANELIDSSYALWTENSQLHVKTTKAGTLKVYGQNGSLIKQLEISSGDASVSLQQGFYVVTFNDGLQQKIVVK